jgi:hypothetical protein
MNSTANQVGQSAKNLAQQIAKQIAAEPLEILKNVREQTTGEELSGQPESSVSRQPDSSPDQQKQIDRETKLQDEMKSQRLMQALNRELEDIEKQNIYSDLQRRISEGETIPLEEYSDLSMEQKQVLKAQMEAVKNQITRSQQAGLQEVPTVHSKPSRRFGAGQKQAAEKEQTHVEKPVSPSG